jgi:hypothetical protein
VKMMPRAALMTANAVLSMILVGALAVLWLLPR